MVRNTYQKLSTSRGLFALFVAAMLVMPAFFVNFVNATVVCTASGSDKQCTDTSTFSVNVSELLTVDITKPASWASGDVNTLLTNKVTVSVSSNNPAGYTASMTTGTNDNTNLTNKADSTKYIPTVASNNTSSTADGMLDHWGYNIVNNNATAPTTFNSMVAKNAATPITVLTANSPVTTTKDVYFGAKASASKASGTYSSNIIISVVSGVYNDPTTPVNPSVPTDDSNNSGGTVAYNENGAAGTATGNTVYTNNYTSGSGSSATSSTYSEISSGNNTSAYSGYTAPQGETNTVAAINEGTPLATGLAVTAAVAAVAGIAFFAVSRHQDSDDDDFE